MSASAFPQSPNAPSYKSSAVQRAIQRKEMKDDEFKTEGVEKKLQHDEGKASHDDSRLTLDKNSQVNGDSTSEVDIPLDSPAQEQEVPLTHIPDRRDSIDEDNIKTPRLRAYSNGRVSPDVETLTLQKSTSSSSVWAGLIASAVDHTDEHVTK